MISQIIIKTDIEYEGFKMNRIEVRQMNKKGEELIFFIHKDFEHYGFSEMSYELLHWTIKNRCNCCTKEKNCEIKRLSCQAAAENYPFHSVKWAIISPKLSILMKKKLPEDLVHCLDFDSIQTNLFEINSSEQQNIMLNEMILQAKNRNDKEICLK